MFRFIYDTATTVSLLLQSLSCFEFSMLSSSTTKEMNQMPSASELALVLCRCPPKGTAIETPKQCGAAIEVCVHHLWRLEGQG